MIEETGWIIVVGDSRLSYWTGGHADRTAFSTDNAEAVRFARKQDAENVINGQEMRSYGLNARAEHHMWCDYKS